MIINHPVPVVYRKGNKWEIYKNLTSTSEYSKQQQYSKFCQKYDICLIRIPEPSLFQKLPLTDVIDITIINKIRNKELLLGIDASHEANYEMVDSCYKLIDDYNFPESQILLIADSHELVEYISQKAVELNKEPIKYEYYSYGEKLAQKLIHSITYEDIPTFKSSLCKQKLNKKFLNLNRRLRPHRCLLLTLLYKRDLIKHGYVSFNEISMNSYVSRMTCYTSFEDRLTEQQLKETVPLVVDEYDRNLNPWYACPRPIFKFYQNTYFSVITETHGETKLFPKFLSEKTFKAISQKHPFLIVSTTGVLQMLRQLGYKTFDGLIDESYDNIEDDSERIIKIADEIERLCNLNETELEEFKRKALDIVEYNYNLLMSKTNFLNQI